MIKNFINISCLLILSVSLILLLIEPIIAQHAIWHSGESCGRCHCGDFQSCITTDNGGCECKNWDVEID